MINKRLIGMVSESRPRIAASVGLLNSSTLIRIFKKYRGITPGAYRKRNQR